jgi:phosphoglucosamine mutase
MLSASHNPMPDNGIKFFARGGHKLDDAIEEQIEARIGEPWDRPLGAAVGRVRYAPDAVQQYEQHLLGTLNGSLDGLRVVVDCANGAASVVAPDVLRRAGAEVIAIHAAPDGLNINDGCGSTHMTDLITAVREHGADAGIAHDGDADRCLAVDDQGNIVDGDHILAILALGLRTDGKLNGDTVVSTVMANLGFRIAMETAGIVTVQTAVGDRYVLEAMRASGFALGGEQSGHVILADHATTGDGVLTALHLLEQMARSGQSLRELASVVDKLPQVLVNVTGVDRTLLDSSPELIAAVAAAEAELGGGGRVLLRPSGTEPVVRVMVEAATTAQAEQIAEQIADVLRGLAKSD